MKLVLELSLAFASGSTLGIIYGVKITHALVGDLQALNAELRNHLQKLSAKL